MCVCMQFGADKSLMDAKYCKFVISFVFSYLIFSSIYLLSLKFYIILFAGCNGQSWLCCAT